MRSVLEDPFFCYGRYQPKSMYFQGSHGRIPGSGLHRQYCKCPVRGIVI